MKQKILELEFDLRGNLKPYEVFEITIEEFKKNFVNRFKNSDTRKQLYVNYLKYINNLKSIINDKFYQYIDGSFITRKINPQDIDIVTFINESTFKQKGEELTNFVTYQAKIVCNMDAYMVIEYPKKSKNYIFTKSNTLYWLNQFGRTRKNRTGRRHKKGIIKIVF